MNNSKSVINPVTVEMLEEIKMCRIKGCKQKIEYYDCKDRGVCSKYTNQEFCEYHAGIETTLEYNEIIYYQIKKHINETKLQFYN